MAEELPLLPMAVPMSRVKVRNGLTQGGFSRGVDVPGRMRSRDRPKTTNREDSRKPRNGTEAPSACAYLANVHSDPNGAAAETQPATAILSCYMYHVAFAVEAAAVDLPVVKRPARSRRNDSEVDTVDVSHSCGSGTMR